MALTGAAEELRRKHIKTLEVLQQFADENERLKADLGRSGAGAAEVEDLLINNVVQGRQSEDSGAFKFKVKGASGEDEFAHRAEPVDDLEIALAEAIVTAEQVRGGGRVDSVPEDAEGGPRRVAVRHSARRVDVAGRSCKWTGDRLVRACGRRPSRNGHGVPHGRRGFCPRR